MQKNIKHKRGLDLEFARKKLGEKFLAFIHRDIGQKPEPTGMDTQHERRNLGRFATKRDNSAVASERNQKIALFS